MRPPDLQVHDQQQSPISSEIDALLTVQIAVAWAGEKGREEPRLGWWRSDLVSEYGGQDLFQRLLPHTWQWAMLQAAREAARRRDAELRGQDHDPDRILSLYRLGFEIDEHVEERLQGLKRSAKDPQDALPGLRDVIAEPWHAERFGDWVQGHGEVKFVKAPIGRRLTGNAPAPLDRLVRSLVAALWPLADDYPLPHYRRTT
jgi:hypothetical protein